MSFFKSEPKNKLALDISFLSSSSIVFVGSLVVNVFNYVFTLVISRLVGVGTFGEITAILGMSVVISVPFSALSMLMTREVASRRALDEDSARNLFIYLRKHTYFAAVIGWVFFIGVSPLLSFFLHIPLEIFLIFSPVIPLSAVVALQTGALSGLQEFFLLSKQNILGAIVKLVVSVLLVLAGFSIVGVIIALVLAQLLPGMYGYFATRSLTQEKTESESLLALRPIRNLFATILLSTFLIALLSNIDLLLAKHFLSSEAAGEYSALSTIGNIIIYGVGAFAIVLLPVVSAAHMQDSKREKYILRLSLFIIAIVTIVASLVFRLFGDLAISILFGARYLSVSPQLSLYAIAEGCIALTVVLVNYFVAIGNKSYLYFLSLGILIEILLISSFHNSIEQIVIMVAISTAFLLVLVGSNYLFIEVSK